MAYKNYNKDMNAYMKRRWVSRRASAVEYLGGVCARTDCLISDELEFDHIDPDTKFCSIARASSFSEKRFWEEVEKCQLLCVEHHKEKTKQDQAKEKACLRD